jgi:hypothetical protein
MEPSIDALRDHVLAQAEPQLTRIGSLRIVSTILSMLDGRGVLLTESLVAVAFEDLEKYLDEEPTSRRTAMLAALAFMAGEDRDASTEAFERLLGDDVSHGLRAEVGEAVARVDRYLQHLGLLRRDVLDGARVEPSLHALLEGLDGDTAQVRHAAQEASRRAVGVRSATRVLAFLSESAPTFAVEPDAGEASEGAGAEAGPVDAGEPSLLELLLKAAEAAWRDGRFLEAKAALDRVLGRDVLHDERDVAVRLGSVLRSRSYSDLACAREAKRELAVVTIGRLTECPASEVRQVLALVHRCDPVGVAARDEAEMVRLHAAWDGAPRLVADLADRALEDFEGEVNYPALSALFELSSDELKAIRATIKRYRAFPVERTVVGVDDSSYDLSFFREGPEFLQEAGWRGEVPAEPTEQLEALGRAILARIEPFMRYGLERLEPVEIAELADAAGLTFDQVGRVSEGVLVDTPWGIVALRHFMRSSPRLGALGG